MSGIEIVVPFRVTGEHSMNMSKHWRNAAADKNDIERAVIAEVRRRGVRKVNASAAVWIQYNSRLDIDNHGKVAKSVIDGLRYAGVLRNDNRRWVTGVYQDFWGGSGIRVVILPNFKLSGVFDERKEK